MRKKKEKEFKVTKDEVNSLYAKLMKSNFEKKDIVQLIDFETDHYAEYKIVNQLSSNLKEIVMLRQSKIDVSLEIIRVEHLIEVYKNGKYDKRPFAYNAMGLFIAIACAFIQPWSNLLDTVPSIIASIILSLIIYSVLGGFLKTFDEFNIAEDKRNFNDGFCLLFYTIYLNVLNTYKIVY